MTTSTTINEIAKALAQAQAEMKAPPRDKTVKTGTFSYNYADLATVIETNRTILSKHGLAVTQLLEGEGENFHLLTLLTHISGQFFASKYPLTKGRAPQQLGSEISYGRRYSLCAILGLAAEDDDDGQRVEHRVSTESPGRSIAPAPRISPIPPSAGEVLKVTEPQLRRLWAISKQAGWDDEQCKMYLKERFGLLNSKDLTRADYDIFCNVIQSINFADAIGELKEDFMTSDPDL